MLSRSSFQTSMCLVMKVRKKAKTKNQYNQEPHLTRDAIRETDKNTRKHNTQECQEVSPFLAGGCRQDSVTKTITNTNDKKDQHKKHHLGTVSKKNTGRLKDV